MGTKVQLSDEQFNRFIEVVKNDPTTEILPTNSEWEAFRYRRPELMERFKNDSQETGVYLYGIVYRNKKGRLNFTGEAETDYRQTRSEWE